MAKYVIEYNANSIKHYPKGADLGAHNLDDARSEVARYWKYDSDLIQIVRLSNTARSVGYVGFNRRTGLYFWLRNDRTCRAFDPMTGKLGKSMRVPAGTFKAIEDNKKTIAEFKKWAREQRRKKIVRRNAR